MRTIRPVERHVLSAEEAMAEVEVSVLDASVAGSHYELHDLVYRGDPVLVQISADLLEGGKVRTQKEWLEVMKDPGWKNENGDYELITAPMYAIVICYLHDFSPITSEEPLTDAMRDDIKQGVMTGSTIRYHRGSDDAIVHHDSRVTSAHARKVSGITGELDEVVANHVFGKDVTELRDAFEWIAGRPNVLRHSDDFEGECAVLMRKNDGVLIDLGVGHDQHAYPARGMKYWRQDEFR
ncbi:hypothetical protein ACFL0V_01420 [Nanoarchaeota archaeon]